MNPNVRPAPIMAPDKRETAPIKVGLCTLAYRDLELSDVVSHAKELGFDELEIWHQHLADKSDRELTDLRQQITDAGMSVSGIAPYFWFTQSEALLVESMRIADDCIHKARLLGARMIRTFTDSGPTGISSGKATPAHWQTAIQSLKAITAKAPDLWFAVETHALTLADTPASCERLLDAVNAENLKVTYQAFDDGNLISDFIRLEPHVCQVHFNTQIAPHPDKGLAHCGIDYQSLLHCLVERNYRGSISLEFCSKDVDHHPALRQGIEWCRELLTTSPSQI